MGVLPRSGGGVDSKSLAETLSRKSEYEVVSNDWIRRHGRTKRATPLDAMRIVRILDRTTHVDETSLEFIQRHFRSGYPTSKEYFGAADFRDLEKLAGAADLVERRWYGMGNLGKAVHPGAPG
jgi:hypothetical protein